MKLRIDVLIAVAALVASPLIVTKVYACYGQVKESGVSGDACTGTDPCSYVVYNNEEKVECDVLSESVTDETCSSDPGHNISYSNAANGECKNSFCQNGEIQSGGPYSETYAKGIIKSKSGCPGSGE
ncbi:MAG: hypothetical protein ACI8QF_004375 [Limisphaerales bacterium]|jgi:hypothetical protein